MSSRRRAGEGGGGRRTKGCGKIHGWTEERGLVRDWGRHVTRLLINYQARAFESYLHRSDT